MAELLLIRHGQARYGEVDFDRLSELGARQAAHIGIELARDAPTAVYCGPMVRQRESVAAAERAAASAGVTLPSPTILDELAEYPGYELVQHLLPPPPRPASAFHDMLMGWARGEHSPVGVETAVSFSARVAAGLECIVRSAGRGARIAVFTSAGPIGVAVGLGFAASPERMIAVSRVVRNASISTFRASAEHGKALTMFTFNQTSHLPLELLTER